MIYLDSCILIYATEDKGELGAAARQALSGAAEGFAISPLVVHETLVIPLRRADQTLIEEYGAFFADCTVVQLGLSDYIHAAELRAATSGLKTVDALHLAAAQRAGCSGLWTNDKRLAAASGSFAVDVIGTT